MPKLGVTIKFFLFFSSFITFHNIIAQGLWKPIDSLITDNSRYGAISFTLNNKAYICTGLEWGLKKDLWMFDNKTMTWTQKADFGGTARFFSFSFAINGKAYTGGGFDINYLKDFWEYDPAKNQWTRKADFGGGIRTAMFGFAVGSKGFAGGGYNGILMNDFWEYNPINDLWTQKNNFPGAARMYAAEFNISTKGYIGLGRDINDNFLNDFWEYNPINDLWIKKTDFPGTPREGAIAFSILDIGFVGTGNSSGSNKELNKDIWLYSPVSDSWEQQTDICGDTRNFASAFSINNKGYIYSGYKDTYLNDFLEFTPDLITTTLLNNDLVLCAGSKISVTYKALFKADANNMFSLFLSDLNGNFNNATLLGNIKTILNDTFNVLIPDNVVNGNAYRLRVISTTPLITGKDNGKNLIIKHKPDSTIYGADSNIRCTGSSTKFTAKEMYANYQWLKDGQLILGATGSDYLLNSIIKSDEGLYSCTISNECSEKISNNIALYVKTKPEVDIAQLNQVVCIGDTVSYSISPGSSDKYLYQWYKNGEIIADKTSNTFFINGLVIDNTGNYQCKISNNCGSTIADISNLKVNNCKGVNVDGYLQYDNAGKTGLNGIVIYLVNPEGVKTDSTTTEANGHFIFDRVVNNVYKIEYINPNNWAGSDPLDGLLINRFYISIIDETDSLKLKAADTNGDGIVNPIDALLVNRRYIQNLTKFPIENWLYDTNQIIVRDMDISVVIKTICSGDFNGSY